MKTVCAPSILDRGGAADAFCGKMSVSDALMHSDALMDSDALSNARAVAGKLGRFCEKLFKNSRKCVPGRDL